MVKKYILPALLVVITAGRKIGFFVFTRHYILYPLLVVITAGLVSDTWSRLAASDFVARPAGCAREPVLPLRPRRLPVLPEVGEADSGRHGAQRPDIRTV